MVGIVALLLLPSLRILLSSFCPIYIWQVCFQQIWQALVGVTGPVPHFHTWLAPSSLAWTNISKGGRTTEHYEFLHIKHALVAPLCWSDSCRKIKKIQFELFKKQGLNLCPVLLSPSFFFMCQLQSSGEIITWRGFCSRLPRAFLSSCLRGWAKSTAERRVFRWKLDETMQSSVSQSAFIYIYLSLSKYLWRKYFFPSPKGIFSFRGFCIKREAHECWWEGTGTFVISAQRR